MSASLADTPVDLTGAGQAFTEGVMNYPISENGVGEDSQPSGASKTIDTKNHAETHPKSPMLLPSFVKLSYHQTLINSMYPNNSSIR